MSLVCDRIGELGDWVRAIEAAGFDAIGFGDSPSLYPEAYVQGTVVALNSSRVMFGPRVTNPITRHPLVTAAAVATLDELSGGRAMVGIGAGDSAAHGVGERPATIQRLRAYVVALRELLDGGRTTYRGRDVRFRATSGRVPIYLAASGPRGLALAGELCDGVIVGTGVVPELVPQVHAMLAEGAGRAGRSLDDLDVWWLMGASIAATREQAREAIATHLAAGSNACLRSGFKGKAVPEELRDRLQALVDGYDYTEHELPGAGRGNVRRVHELALFDYLARRFAVADTAEGFAARVEELAGWGADRLWLTMPLPDKYGFLDAVRTGVVPRLRAPVTP
ncbi:MAG: LLM class flavin-dependent oxidoreductase [Solirubrobacteraceae bacterium]